MTSEVRKRLEELIESARAATGELRDAAREGRIIGFRQRDEFVMSIHRALDELAAVLALPEAQQTDYVMAYHGALVRFQAERERLHDILQHCDAVIDPELHPDLRQRIDAVLSPCDEAGKCVGSTALPEAPAESQQEQDSTRGGSTGDSQAVVPHRK